MNSSTRLLAGLVLFLGLIASAAAMTVPLSNNQYHVFRLAAEQPTQSIEFNTANASTLIIDVHTPADQAVPAVSLTGPAGIGFGPDQFNAFTLDENQTPALGSVLLETGRHTQIEIETPPSGNWTLAIALPDGESEVIGNATVVKLGGSRIGAFTSRPLYTSNRPAVIGAALFEGSSAVVGAHVEAKIYPAPDATPYSVTLYDSGISPDAAQGDGLYTGSITGLPAGHYTVEAVATVGAVDLVSGTEFHVIEPLAQFNGEFNDSGVDANGDGLLDEIRLGLGLDVTEPGGYALLGRLTAGDLEVTTGTRVELDIGTTDAELVFPAAAIRDYLGVDGPYQIADVILLKTGHGDLQGDLAIDRLANAGETRAYEIDAFTRPAVVIKPGLTDSATDHDGDGLYDELAVTFGVELLRAGTYTWSGLLQTEDGASISVSSNRNHLGAGEQQLTLRFTGTDIGESELDGPYYLRDVALYGQAGTAAVSSELGTTNYYHASEFAGSEVSFTRLLRKIQELVITGRGGKPRADGIRISLLRKAENASRMVEDGRTRPASNLLQALQREILAQAEKHISADEAVDLVDLIDRLNANH